MNETSIYIMYTYDLCNDYFQKNYINQNLQSRIWCSEEIVFFQMNYKL